MPRRRISDKLRAWIEARKRHGLSHAQIQMARELGMNPKKLGKLDNADQEPWKVPLPAFIENLYWKRFRRDRPAVVLSVEERARLDEQKREAGREARRQRREGRTNDGTSGQDQNNTRHDDGE